MTSTTILKNYSMWLAFRKVQKKIPSHSVRMPVIKEIRDNKSNAGENVEEREDLFSTGRNVKWSSPCEN